MGQPGVDGHVGHDARAVDEAGLGADQQQRPLGEDGDQGQGVAERPAAVQGVGQDGVERLGLPRRDLQQQVAEEQAAGGEGQRDRHVQHGLLAGLHLGLAQDLHAVGHGLDAGVGAAAQRVGAQEQGQHAQAAQRGQAGVEVGFDAVKDGADLRQVREDAVADHENVGHHEDDEDGGQEGHRLLDPAQVEHDQQQDQEEVEEDLVRLPGDGQEAEQGVSAGDDGDGDGQHVVDQQGVPGDDPDPRPERVGGDDVAAAAVGEALDDARIGVGNDEDGQRRGQGQEDGQVGVLAQGAEGLLRAVGG